MSLHGDDYKAAAGNVVAWFKAHPAVAQFLGGLVAGIIGTLIFTWG